MTKEQPSVLTRDESGELQFVETQYLVGYRQTLQAFERHKREQREAVEVAVGKAGSFVRLTWILEIFQSPRGSARRSSGEDADALFSQTREDHSINSGLTKYEAAKVEPPKKQEFGELLDELDEGFFDTSDFENEINKKWGDAPDKSVEFQGNFWKKRASK